MAAQAAIFFALLSEAPLELSLSQSALTDSSQQHPMKAYKQYGGTVCSHPGCDRERAASARYCRECKAEYMRRWRRKKKEALRGTLFYVEHRSTRVEIVSEITPLRSAS